MYLSLNWLKDFVDIPKKMTPEELGLRLTMHTVEIEGIKKEADKYDKVVVGKILEVKKHPNADRLRLAKVNVGSAVLDIVCGAPNISSGQLAPVALPGAVLSNGMEIREAEVRGEKSQGMLCAEDELGLSDDHSAILILDKKKAKVGMNFADYLGAKDIVLEVDNKSITHRPDLWCHYGLAREIAAFLGTHLKVVLQSNLENLAAGREADSKAIGIKVKVEDTKLCPRYMALPMTGIKIEKSPKWLEDRLLAVGLRPISNIVDVTNYVMLELGQPMHAFDINQVRSAKSEKSECQIIVRRAKPNETIETLDGEERKLDESMLVIANDERALAVAGVMGGANSEINSETTAIVLESANFDPVSVRKTGAKLGLRTESSMRYEKSLDPNLCALALSRAAEYIKMICPTAKVAGDFADMCDFTLNQGPITVDLRWLNRRLGEKIETRKIVKILESLGFGVEKSEHALQITVPSWRATKDISIAEDILEEVARIYGYDNLVPAMPKVEMRPPEVNAERAVERQIKNILSGAPGLAESYNYSFVGEDQLGKLNISQASFLSLANPIVAHQTLLRQSLLPNLINNIRTNQARFDAFGFFELGSVYFDIEGNLKKNNSEFLPYQEKHLGIILADSDQEKSSAKIKGILEYFLGRFNIRVDFRVVENKDNWETSAVGEIYGNGELLGRLVGLGAKLERSLGLKKSVAAAELKLPALLQAIATAGTRRYCQPDRFPAAERDLAFVINRKISYNEIKTEIAGFNSLIRSVEVFDVFEGEALGKDKKSLAFHVEYYNPEKTLTSEEVDRVQVALVQAMAEKFGAKLRDF